MMQTVYIFLELGQEPGKVLDLRFFATHKEAEDHGKGKTNNMLIGEWAASEKEASTLLRVSRE
jgi:hypothetical protein